MKIPYELTSAETVGDAVTFAEVVVGSIESHAVPTTPRSIPKSAKIAITCTQVIRIFAIERNELKRWEYSEKPVTVTWLFFCLCFGRTTDTRIRHVLIIF